MSVYGALYSGVSGLKAGGNALSIISDNISNANTVGYKGNKASFETLVTQSPSKRSYSAGGVLSNTRALVDQQGLIQASDSNTDLSITGRGFFAVANAVDTAGGGTIPLGTERLFTRAGQFAVDKAGYLKNDAGYYLLGQTVAPNATIPTASNPVDQLVGINVGSITGSAAATANVTLGANFAASTLINTGTVAAPLAGSFTDQQLTIYDSLGIPNQLTIRFDKTSANNWRANVIGLTYTDTAGATQNSTAVAITAAAPRVLGTIQFNADGTINVANFSTGGSTIALTNGAKSIILPSANVSGTATYPTATNTATTQDLVFNFGTLDTTTGLTQYDSVTATSFINQDGIKFGYRTGVAIDDDGTVRAIFDNGQRLTVARIPLVTFADVNSLQARTGNVYAETDASGSSTPNFPKTGGAGSVAANSLESSTVDTATEFTNMIVVQRNYSANAKVINTADEMLQDLLSLKR
jgi:flagellar hook protein FlgE